MRFSLSELARISGATLVGGDQVVDGICPAEEPRPSHLTFLRDGDSGKAIDSLAAAGVSAVAVSDKLASAYRDKFSLLVAADPVLTIAKLLPSFHPPVTQSAGISPEARVSSKARIGENVSIGAFCTVAEGVEIGDRVTLWPGVHLYPGVKIGTGSVLHSNVSVRENCVVGRGCLIHNGAVIGADGFGFVPDPQTGLHKVPQVGTVEIGDFVEIGANSCVDRATLGVTRIGSHTKLDNLVQIGHNVQVGNFTLICAASKIGGSSKIGSRVVIGGGVGVADHVEVADACRFAGMSGITNDIKKRGDYAGIPAMPVSLWRREVALLRRLAKGKRTVPDSE